MNRTQHTMKNLYFAALSQMISTLMAFLCRTVFIHTLGKTYLGFSGLFADILRIFFLAELGIGSVLTYEMYGPAAKHDAQELARLLAVYRKLYRYVGAVVSRCKAAVPITFRAGRCAFPHVAGCSLSLKMLQWDCNKSSGGA